MWLDLIKLHHLKEVSTTLFSLMISPGYVIYFLRFKSKVATVFWKFKAWIENQSCCRIQVLKSDNGNEYTSN